MVMMVMKAAPEEMMMVMVEERTVEEMMMVMVVEILGQFHLGLVILLGEHRVGCL